MSQNTNQPEALAQIVADLIRLAQHAPDCLSRRPLDTGQGCWHCDCGYDRLILDGELSPDIALSTPTPEPDAGREDGDDLAGALTRIGNELRQKCKNGGHDCEICDTQRKALNRAIAIIQAATSTQQGGEPVAVAAPGDGKRIAEYIGQMEVGEEIDGLDRKYLQEAAAMLAAATAPPVAVAT